MEENLSTDSSTNSVIEYIHTIHEESELEISSANSISIDWEDVTKDDMVLNNDKDSMNTKKSGFRKMYLASAAVLLNAVCLGYAGAYSSTATDDMHRESSPVRPNDNQIGWIGSLLALGAIVGGIVAGTLTDYAGRKGALLLNLVPQFLGWILIAYATSLTSIYVGRIILGFCCSIIMVNAPMYLIEISTPDIRGLLGASFQLFATLGVFLVSCLGAIIPWTWSAMSAAILTVITLAATIFIPESPRWLMTKGRKEEALWTIKFLQGNFLDAEKEMEIIQENLDNQPKGSLKISELKTPEVYKPALLSFGLLIAQQCCGDAVILFYTVAIFKKATTVLKATSASIIVNAVKLVATIISSILIDRFGRKILLLMSTSIMTLSLLGFGGFDFAVQKDTTATVQTTYGWLPILCINIYMAAYSLGLGPVPWVMLSEMTTVRFRTLTAGVGVVLNWVVIFIMTKTVHQMEDAIHTYGTYWTYAGMCILSGLFAYFFLPETKGKRIEDIHKYFISKSDESTVMKSVEVINKFC